MDNTSPKPHALCLPFPLQSHIKAMLKLSKLLHHKGFHITFVNTEYNHKRFLKSNPMEPYHSLSGLGFRLETIPDGLPDSDSDSAQDIPSLCDSTRKNFSAAILDLVVKINDNAMAGQDGVVSPRVSCMVVDGFVCVNSAAQELGIPLVKFFSIAANGLVGLQQYRPLLERGLVPLKDETSLTNGYLDNTFVDWVPGMKGLRLRDLPSSSWISDPDDFMFNFGIDVAESAHDASAVVLHTFDALERDVLDLSLSAEWPHLYTIGPLQLLLNRHQEDPLVAITYNLWKEETECLKWLNTQKPNSVVYVNFGSTTVLTPQQVVDIGWGLANSHHPFLWVIRPDLVLGESASLSEEFVAETRERSLITSWCPQEDVLNHPSVGGFWTHCGWNSVIESVSSGVPLLCFPFFADQPTNCWFACNGLGVGLEIGSDVKRGQVEELVRELTEGEKGKRMKAKAMEWKKLAEEATSPQGSSSRNLDNLINQVLL